MNKRMLAAAVSAAVSLPAAAQNVSLYGIMDASVLNVDRGAYSSTVVSSGILSSSRLGFQGSEDLGGGLKAYLKLEGRLAFDSNGALGTSSIASTSGTTTTGTGIFNRDAFVGISGGFGSIQIGTQATDTNIAVAAVNATGFNIGDANATFSSSLFNLGDRTDNTVRYISPSFGGVTVTATSINGEAASSSTYRSARDGYGATLSYSANDVRAIWATTQRQAATSLTTAPVDTVYGFSYDFGMAKIGLSNYTSDASKNATNNKIKVNSLTAGVPLGGGLALHGALYKAKIESGYSTTWVSTSGAGSATAYNLGLVKELSKRTSVYGVYGSVNNNSNSLLANPLGLSVSSAGQDSTGFGFGVRHAF